MVSSEADTASVAKRWDTTATSRTANPIQGWMDSLLVLESCVLPKLGAGPGRHWLVAAAERLGIPRTGRWLSLGCGAAGTEIAAAGWGLFASMLALDTSPASLDIARKNADESNVTNIEFGTADLNRLVLPRSAFDVVLMNMSLHHVTQLRDALTQVRASLRPNGFLIANEFVGPRQFQFTDLQLGLVNELLRALPAGLRQDCATGGTKESYARMSLEHWNIADPSEAIRSDCIIPEIERQFRVVDRVDYGGTILHLLFEHIIHNFDAADEKALAIIRLLGYFEDVLIRNGVIPSDFTLIAATPLPGFQRAMRSTRAAARDGLRAAMRRLRGLVSSTTALASCPKVLCVWL